MAKYQLTTGVQRKPLKMFVYGPEGVGKSTFAAQMPEPVFIDVEDGSNQLNIARLPQPTSWTMLMDELNEVYAGNVPCSSIVIDTVDAAQDLAIREVCAEHGISGIEKLDYGKGYVYVYERWCKMLDLLDAIRTKLGVNVVLVGHSRIDRTERPDLDGTYDRFVPNLNNGRRSDVSGRTRAWCDTVLFVDYKTIVNTEADHKGNIKKAKAKGGGRRVVHTTHGACWDAKNRFGWADEVPLEDAFVQSVCGVMTYRPQAVAAPPMQPPTQQPAPMPPAQPVPPVQPVPAPPAPQAPPMPTPEPVPPMIEVTNDPRMAYKCKPLADLMFANGVTDVELRSVVGAIGTRPAECAVNDYPEGFPEFLAANFADKVLPKVMEQRQA